MRKVLSLIVLLLLVIGISGCSTEELSKNSETPTQSIQIENQDNNEDSLDIYSMDDVYLFLHSIYPEYSKDNYEKWNVSYLDVTEDGFDDVIFTSTYGDGELESAIIITAEKDGFREISRYIPLSKYANNMEMKDGLLINNTRTGGSDSFSEYMDIYSYDGQYINVSRQNILVKETVENPSANYEISSTIEGNLEDFIITYTKKNFDDSQCYVIAKDRYVLNENLEYNKIPISLDNSALGFDSVFTGENLLETIQYFNDNLYLFEDELRVNYAKEIFNVLEEEKMVMTEWGNFITIPEEYVNLETMNYDISIMKSNEPETIILEKIKNSNIFTLVKVYYADQGLVQDNGFNVIINGYVYSMLQPAYEIMCSNDESFNLPFLKPDIYFTSSYMSEKVVTMTHIVYPNVVVENIDDIEFFEGKDTWKTNLLVRLNIVGKPVTP